MNQAHKLSTIRKLRKMTMKNLGMALGFDESSASVRIAQWENGSRNPKADTIEKMAAILDVNPRRLAPVPENPVDSLIEYLIWDGESGISFEDKIRLVGFLSEFWMQREGMQNGTISKAQYDEWRMHWPDPVSISTMVRPSEQSQL